MDPLIGQAVAAALGLVAWPVIASLRVKRWGQALLLMAASVLAPFVGLYGAVLVMWNAMSGMPMGVIVVAMLFAWIAALAVPVVLGFVLHLLGRYTPPSAAPQVGWRSPDV